MLIAIPKSHALQKQQQQRNVLVERSLRVIETNFRTGQKLCGILLTQQRAPHEHDESNLLA